MNSADSPIVSIGLPTFNRCAYLRIALSSILTQDYVNMEIIISDNASTDNTELLCVELCERDSRIKYYRQIRNIGAVPNFEFVLKKASGPFFMWVADDDKLEPTIIKKYVDFLRNHPRYALVSGEINHWGNGAIVFVEKEMTFAQSSGEERLIDFYRNIEHGGMIYGLMRRELAVKAPLRNVMGADWIFVGALAYLCKIKNLAYPGYNKDRSGMSKSFMEDANTRGLSYFAAYFPYLSISFNVFGEILYRCSVYSDLPFHKRFRTALSAFWGIFRRYYKRTLLSDSRKFFSSLVYRPLKRTVIRICHPKRTLMKLLKQKEVFGRGLFRQKLSEWLAWDKRSARKP